MPAPLPSRRGRLILGAEPIAVQVERYRRATWVLTAVAGAVGSMILAIFVGFGAVGTGAVVVGSIFGPVVALAWLAHWRLVHAASKIEPAWRNPSDRSS